MTAGNYPDVASAKLARSVLAGSGIAATIPDEFFAGIDWQMTAALHGIRVEVAPEDLEAAQAVLAEGAVLLPEAEESGEPVPAAEVCALCGAGFLGQPKWKLRVRAIAMLFPVVVLAWPLLAAVLPRFQCTSCGHAWR